MLHTPRALPALAACGPSGVPSRIGLHPVSPVTSACPRRSPGPAAVLAPAPRVVTGLQDSAGAAPAAVTEPPTPQGSAPPAVSGSGAGGRGLSPSVLSTARRLLLGKAVSSHKPAGTRPPASSVPSRVPSQRCSTSARLEPHLPPRGPRATCAPGLRRRCVPRVQLSASPTSS